MAAHMVMALEVRSIRLMTNNPKKVRELEKYGVNVAGRIPVLIKPDKHNKRYLKTKMEKS